MTLQNTVNQTAYEQQISASLSSGAGQCRAEVECVCEPSYWVLEWRRQEGSPSLLGDQSQESFIFKLYHPLSQSFVPKPLTLGVRTRTRTLGDTVCSPQQGTKGNCCSLSKGPFRSSTLIWSSPSTLFTEMPIHETKYLPKTCICILKLRTSHYTSLSKNVNINIKDPSITNPETCCDRHSWGRRRMMGVREEQEEEEEEEQQPYFPTDRGV